MIVLKGFTSSSVNQNRFLALRTGIFWRKEQLLNTAFNHHDVLSSWRYSL